MQMFKLVIVFGVKVIALSFDKTGHSSIKIVQSLTNKEIILISLVQDI